VAGLELPRLQEFAREAAAPGGPVGSSDDSTEGLGRRARGALEGRVREHLSGEVAAQLRSLAGASLEELQARQQAEGMWRGWGWLGRC